VAARAWKDWERRASRGPGPAWELSAAPGAMGGSRSFAAVCIEVRGEDEAAIREASASGPEPPSTPGTAVDRCPPEAVCRIYLILAVPIGRDGREVGMRYCLRRPLLWLDPCNFLPIEYQCFRHMRKDYL